MAFKTCFVAATLMALSVLPRHAFAQPCERLAEAVRRNAANPGTLARELQQKPDVNCRLESGETPLLLAARAGDTAGVADLLSQGADPNVGRNARSPSTVIRVPVSVETPLILAAGRGNEAMVRTLLTAGARALLTWTGEGASPSQLALERGHRETFRILKAAEEAEYGPSAGRYVEEDIALRRILYLAQHPRDVSTKSAPDGGLLVRIARDASGMDRNWRAFKPRDPSFSWAITHLARTLEWALHTGDNRLLRIVADDLATKRRDCDATSEGRFGTVRISVRTLANASERQGLQVRYLERIFYDLLDKKPELQKQWREFAAVSAIRDEPVIAGDYVLVALDNGKAVSEPKPISVGRDRPTQFDIVIR